MCHTGHHCSGVAVILCRGGVLMKRTSKYFELKYFVECKAAGRFAFEPIAAFDNECVAKNYCDDCLRGKPFGFGYRVVKRGKYAHLYRIGVDGGSP
jgi:hypothetical protein